MPAIRDSAARQLSLTLPSIARLDLSDEEREELLRLLRGVIAGDRFLLSPRIRSLRQILERLEPPTLAAEPFPTPKPPAEPTHAWLTAAVIYLALIHLMPPVSERRGAPLLSPLLWQVLWHLPPTSLSLRDAALDGDRFKIVFV